jgi:hypothetical protein
MNIFNCHSFYLIRDLLTQGPNSPRFKQPTTTTSGGGNNTTTTQLSLDSELDAMTCHDVPVEDSMTKFTGFEEI